jgi:hypothetical protein
MTDAGPRTAVAATGVAAVLTVMLMLSIGFGQLDTSMAPTLIMQLQLLDHLAPAHRLNEAQAFLSASNTTVRPWVRPSPAS